MTAPDPTHDIAELRADGLDAAVAAYLSASTRAENAQVQIGQSGVTDGVEWVVVPKEPTEAMMDAAVAVVEKPCFPQDIYRAMLAAAGGENA